MSAGPAFTVTHGGPSGVVDFVRAVVRHLDGRALAVAIALAVVAGCGIVLAEQDVWDNEVAIIAGRIAHNAVTALVILVAVLVADQAVDRGLRPLPAYAVAIVAASIAGSFLGHEIREALRLPDNLPPITPLFPWMRRIEVAFIGMFLGSLATVAHVSRRNALAARRRQGEAEKARAHAQRIKLESELQALQARIEPEFLFETLHRIRDLYRVDAGAAGAMLGDLIAYLRAALPHLRESVSTVERELSLARAWLDIVGRSTSGLAVDVEVDPAIREAPLPALVLLPVVQRALADAQCPVQRLHIAAKRRDASLHFCIETNTAAFDESAAGSLQPLGDRLRALYGDSASLRVGTTADGSRAEVEIPLGTGPEGRGS
jgi:hypothetical protein